MTRKQVGNGFSNSVPEGEAELVHAAQAPRTKLIVGLGNPGSLYARHRHSIGFRCLNHFARLHNIAFSKVGGHSRLGEGKVGGIPVVLAKPRTFVNESGKAVGALLLRFRLSSADLIVVYDDLDLSLGSIRLRPRGSAGGHKGMQSIIRHIGTPDFARLRLGIGRPQEEGEDAIISYVLSNFAAAEEPLVATMVERAAEALACALTEGLDIAMSRFN